MQKSDRAGRFHRVVLSTKMRNESRGNSGIVLTADLTVVLLNSITRIITVALRDYDSKQCVSSLILLARRSGYGV